MASLALRCHLLDTSDQEITHTLIWYVWQMGTESDVAKDHSYSTWDKNNGRGGEWGGPGNLVSCIMHETWWICKFIAEDRHKLQCKSRQRQPVTAWVLQKHLRACGRPFCWFWAWLERLNSCRVSAPDAMKEQHQRLSGLAAFSNWEETPVLQAFFLSRKTGHFSQEAKY